MNKKMIWKILVLILIIWLIWFLKFAKHYPSPIDLQAKDDFWGVTFSPKFAKEIGLDWQEVYLAVLDDLEVKNIRLPVYWNDIEVKEGRWDFSTYDFILDEGAKRDIKFIVNLGWRLPRWPECHTPAWLNNAETETIKEKVKPMLVEVVNRYKDRSEIVAWQVENEPLLDTFGVCPDGDEEFLKEEIELVKSLDDRPIIISASGELSSWRKEAKLADIFGTTMYRVIWNDWFKYFRYPLPTWFYQQKAKGAGKNQDQVIISELQAEPWVPYHGSVVNLSLEEKNKSFNIDQFKANLQFAINTDFQQAYLWGVEWWYWERQDNSPMFWDLAKSLFDK